MISPAKFSVMQPVLINMLMFLAIVAGLTCFRNMPRDLFPDVSVETIVVTTVMPGTSPKEVEQLITIPLEEELANVDEVDEMVSTSSEGVSTITLTFQPGIENFFEKLTEVQNEVDKVSDLPEEAESPIIREIKVHFDTITVCLSGNAPEQLVKDFAEKMDDELRQVDGVAEVILNGLREREIWIEVDPQRLYAYNLSMGDLAEILRRRNVNTPAGSIRVGRSEITLRNESEFKTVQDIADTIILDNGASGFVYLRDVAEIRDTFEERTSLARIDGLPAVTLTVQKDKRSNAIVVVEKLRDVIDRMAPLAPAGVTVRTIEDRSVEIKTQLDALGSNLGFGLVLVMCSLALFIGFRAAFMVALGLPAAFLGTFVLMAWFGFTINILTLFSLILVLGLIVDDAIVVCENVYRLYEEGYSISDAVIEGTRQITWPVIATVATTIAAFLPLLLMSGILGRFMGVIPVVVTMALICSLIECLIILPAHIFEFGIPKSLRDNAEHRNEPKAWMVAMMSGYETMMRGVLRIRYLVVPLVLVGAFFAVQLAAGMDRILFGGRDLSSFSVTLEGPPSASLDETTRVLTELESHGKELVKSAPEVEYISLRSGGVVAHAAMGLASRATNTGEFLVKLVPLSDRDRLGQLIREEYRRMIGDVTGFRTMTFEDRTEGPPTGKPVQVRVRGDNFDTLKKIAGDVMAELRTIEGVTDIMDNFPPGKDEVRPVFDWEKLRGFGVSAEYAAREVRGAFDGLVSTTIQDGDEEIDVLVKFNEANRGSLNDLSELWIQTPRGRLPLSNFARLERTEGYSHISHFDRKRSINVIAEVIEGVTTSTRVNEELQRRFADAETRYPGYSLTFGGEYEDTQESMASLFQAFYISIILIYVILGGLFRSYIQPLIVMFTVPFSFIGVIIGFYVMNEPLGMACVIGIIALSGIVVNDGLILIEFINGSRRAGMDLRYSIVRAGAVRLRPVILTSITTILGLVPMAMNMFGADPMMNPMALAVVWGLTFSTVLTLIVIPCVYAIVDDFSTVVMRVPLGVSREQYRAMKSGGA